jgi:GxxExxY protein
MRDGKHADLTSQIIRCFYTVYNTMGYGFSETVYKHALAHELALAGVSAIVEAQLPVYYQGRRVGLYKADLLVNGVVIVELKSVKSLIDEHEAQLLSYLKATDIEVGLLLNFGPEAQIMRRVYDNERKGSLNWTDRLESQSHLDTPVSDTSDSRPRNSPRRITGSLNLVVLRVADLDRAATFYTALGLEFNRHSHGTGPEHLASDYGGVVFELYPASANQAVSTSTRIGFSVDDLDEAIATVTPLPGYQLISPPQESEWGRRTVIADPDGHRVELIEKGGR